jgi:hypothetical protein
VECRSEPLARAGRRSIAPARKDAADPQKGCGRRDGIQREKRIVPCEGQKDACQPGKIATEAQKPEARTKGFRDAKPNGAQRRPL